MHDRGFLNELEHELRRSVFVAHVSVDEHPSEREHCVDAEQDPGEHGISEVEFGFTVRVPWFIKNLWREVNYGEEADDEGLE